MNYVIHISRHDVQDEKRRTFMSKLDWSEMFLSIRYTWLPTIAFIAGIIGIFKLIKKIRLHHMLKKISD